MVIYIVNVLLIMMYSLIVKKRDKKQNKKIITVIIIIQLFLIQSLRNISVGIDVETYLDFFANRIPNFTISELFSHRFELGYKLLNKTVSLLTTNKTFFLALISAMSIIPVGRFIYKYSKVPNTSFALYIAFNFYAFTFSGFRQSIAIGIVLISFDYIVQRKLIKFLVTVLVASLFHISALFFIPAYFITKIKLNNMTILLIIILNSILYLFRIDIFKFFTQYIFENYELIETEAGSWMLLGILIVMVCLFNYRKVINVEKSNNSIYILSIFGVSLMLFSTVGSNTMRIVNYYYIFIIILIPEVLRSIRNIKIYQMSLFIINIGIIILLTWFLIYSDTYRLVPYDFFW